MPVASCRVLVITIRMRYVLLIFIFFLFPVAAYCLEITELQVERIEHGEHVRIGLSAKAKYDIFIAESRQPRLVVDLPMASLDDDVGLPDDYQDPLISNIRFSHHDKKSSRLVFDFIEPVKLGSTKLVHRRHIYWLVFDVFRDTSSRSASHTKSASKVKSGRTNAKPVIVIDAGHGGQDNGTSGYAGSKEKDLTLHYAEELQDALIDTGHYSVVLTRDDDRYLFLGERVRRAREAKGNLFISIHADSAPQASARGLSVYTISEKASDKQSEMLAEKENKADIIGGMDLSDTSKDVADILIDLTERETRAKSNKFADRLVKNFRHDVNLLNHTHRFAGFAVLKAPDIPSVLIEVGFLTNPNEERLLKTSPYQEKFIHGVIGAIDSYFSK